MARPLFDENETWVRSQNVARHPGFNVKDYPIKMSEDAMTVGRVITDVLAGVQMQSNELYNKNGAEPKCKLTIDGNGAITVALKGKKVPIDKKIDVPHVKMELEVPGGPYVLAQYVTSRLCHGIGDYFCGMKDQVANWDNIAADIVQCVTLMHTIENPPVKHVKPPKPPPTPKPQPPPPKTRSPETKRFIDSITLALENSRLKGYSQDLQQIAAAWIAQMEQHVDEIHVNVQIDMREIAGDKIAVYAKVRPITSGTVHGIAQKKAPRLSIEPETSCIFWNKADSVKVKYGPYKNIVSTESNHELLDRNRLNNTDNLAGLLKKCVEGGGLEYDAIRTLANGIDVVLFGYGHSGTGKTFSLFGDSSKTPKVEGSVQLILAHVKHVKLRNVFEEAPGGKFKFGNDDPVPDYDGHVVRLYDADNVPPFTLIKPEGIPPSGSSSTNCKKPKKGSSVDDRILIRPLKPKQRLDTPEGIMAYIDEVTKYRREKLRIRATLNNGQSSRSHLYMVMDVWCGDDIPTSESTARLTIIDLGGIETPDSMIEASIKSMAKAWSVTLERNKKSQKLGTTIPRSDAQKGVKETIFTSRLCDRVTGKNTKFKYEIVSTISTCYSTLMGNDTNKALQDEYNKSLIADLVAAYRDITEAYIEAIKDAKTGNAEKTYKDKIKNSKYAIVKTMGLKMNPFASQYSQNPIAVMYPTSDEKAPDVSTQKHLLRPPVARVSKEELVGGNYFSLFHLAALYIEGSYIVESLKQLKQYIRNDRCAPDNGSVLTTRILKSLTHNRMTRHIMLFTMCPIKMQAEQDNSDVFDKNFMQPAKFVQDVCSTVNEESAQDEDEDEVAEESTGNDEWVTEPND
jgi:hypothetical protein